MHLIEVNLRDTEISSELVDGTLCVFRPVYDKPTATTYGMKSAVHVFKRGPCFRRLYCVEQYDNADDLVKFSISLTDENKIGLGEWHLDISHGLHTHPIVGGKKSKEHVSYPRGVADMAMDIVAAIKAGL